MCEFPVSWLNVFWAFKADQVKFNDPKKERIQVDVQILKPPLKYVNNTPNTDLECLRSCQFSFDVFITDFHTLLLKWAKNTENFSVITSSGRRNNSIRQPALDSGFSSSQKMRRSIWARKREEFCVNIPRTLQTIPPPSSSLRAGVQNLHLQSGKIGVLSQCGSGFKIWTRGLV